MGLFDQFPYTNFHELNLDWVLQALKELEHTVEQFVAINALKYADPIQWDITSQYEKNTIVVDPQSGTAYISVQAVPSGIGLTNTDYWSVVFDLERITGSANNNLTVRVEPATTLNATFATNTGEWVIWNGVLYEALTSIVAGDQYVIDSNIKKITVEEIINTLATSINATLITLENSIGDLADLNTTDKSNLVAAINEVLSTLATSVGNLANLNTTDKSNLVAAINETVSAIQTVSDKFLYLNVKDFGAVGDGATDDTAAVQAAIDAAIPKSIIVFPAGSYAINGTVNISKNGITVAGVGVNSIITRSIQSNTPIFIINNGNTRITGFKSHDLQFKDITNGHCFKLVYVFDSEIYDCHIDNIKALVRYGDTDNNNMNIWSRIHNIIGNVSVQNASFIEMFFNTNGLHVYDCQINSEQGLNAKFIDVSAFTAIDTLEVRNNLIQRMTNPIAITNDYCKGAVLQNFFIKGNIMDSCYGSNITVNATSAGIICRIMIENNWFSCVESQSNNLVFTGTSGTITQVGISNNTIVESRLRAILTQGNNVKAIKIIGNTFNGFNVDTPLAAIESAITISGTSSEIMISDNMMAPSSDAQGNNTYGIYLATGATNIILNGNSLIGVTTPLTGTPSVSKGNLPASIDI